MCVTVLCVPACVPASVPASGLVSGEWSFCVSSIFLRWPPYVVALVKICDEVLCAVALVKICNEVLCAVALVMIFDWVVCFVVPWYL